MGGELVHRFDLNNFGLDSSGEVRGADVIVSNDHGDNQGRGECVRERCAIVLGHNGEDMQRVPSTFLQVGSIRRCILVNGKGRAKALLHGIARGEEIYGGDTSVEVELAIDVEDLIGFNFELAEFGIQLNAVSNLDVRGVKQTVHIYEIQREKTCGTDRGRVRMASWDCWSTVSKLHVVTVLDS